MPLPVIHKGDAVDVSYSTDDVCRILGVSYRMVDYWIRRGVIHPTSQTRRGAPEIETHGSGSARRFSGRDVTEIRVAVGLRHLGIGLDEISDVLATVRTADPGDLVIWNGERARVVPYEGEHLADVIRAYGGIALVIAVIEE